jgi:hypothetical protein
MSLAEFTLMPYSVFARLAVVLRNIPVVQFVIAKLSAVRANNKGCYEGIGQTIISEAPGIPENVIDQHVVILNAIAAPKSAPQSESREELIRRRWTETGSKMWDHNIHGAGLTALNIQGRVALLPLISGETLPRHDKLEFRLVGDRIVCEGVFVDPPKRRK